MKPCIMITGPQAVGKMSVGLALQDKYNYRLFHNHMTIELVNDLYGQLKLKECWDLIGKLRHVIFDDVIERDLEGFTFTYMWGFNLESDHQYVDDFIKRFESKGWQVYIVELEADVETRLQRNGTPLRLEKKATKRNLEWSNRDLKASLDKYRLNSNEGEITHPNYMRINNSNLEPAQVADMIYQYINEQ